MLNKEKHKSIMTQVLKDIYSDISIASLLGFKGGTAAYLFYDLPRFSVDLDFDILDDAPQSRELVFEKIGKIISVYGTIKDQQMKFSTIFFALSYGTGEHQVKVEVNTRKTGAKYELKSYLGIPMLVAKKESLLSGKLVALLNRKVFAPRDLYDAHFFLKQQWEFDYDVFAEYGISSVKEYLKKCENFVEKIPQNKFLAGLGELISEEEKKFVREQLKNDMLFLLRLRSETEG
jgi:predicted nucleotidyltransferase component of viral defense system